MSPLTLDPADAPAEVGTAAPAFSGLLRFIHYGFMPNHYGYCGGDDNREILERGAAAEVDRGVEPLLRKFAGALPYLKLIARANAIADPFDDRVVEAYWLGNDLLRGVEVRQLYDHLVERFGRQLPASTMKWIASKAPAGARPHHNFHVFDLYTRAGDPDHSLDTMDNCRVSWGAVVADLGSQLLVERQPLVLLEGKLRLGPAEPFLAARQIDGRGFVGQVAAGAQVALHWGWVCEELTNRQLTSLRQYTAQHLALANQTL